MTQSEMHKPNPRIVEMANAQAPMSNKASSPNDEGRMTNDAIENAQIEPEKGNDEVGTRNDEVSRVKNRRTNPPIDVNIFQI
jgi:hypothetical protein